MNYFRLLIVSIFFFTQPSFAAPELTNEQYLKQMQVRLQNSKTFQEFVNKTDELPEKIKKEVLAWVEKNELKDLSLSEVKLNGSDIVLKDHDGQKFKITYTDPKRGVIHINNQKAVIDINKSTAENLTSLAQLASDKKSASNFFMDRAEAVPVFIVVAAVIAIIALAFNYYSNKNSPETLSAKIKELMSSAGIKEIELNCSAPVNTDDVMNNGMQLTYRAEDSAEIYYRQERILVDRKGKEPTLIAESYVSKPGTYYYKSNEDTIPMSTSSQALVEISKQCCERSGCEDFLKKSLPGLSPLESGFGTGKRKSTGQRQNQ